MGTSRDSSTKSPWQAFCMGHQGRTISLKTDNELYDVLVIGGGLTGISTALALQQEGKKCVILEGNNLGYGTTGGTSAHINTFFDSTYPEIENDFGQEAAKLIAMAGIQARDQIEANVRAYHIECQFEHKIGYLFSQNEKQTDKLKEILRSAGSAGVAVSEAKTNGIDVPFESSLQFNNQAQFHPIAYISALMQEFIKLGGKICEHTFVDEVDSSGEMVIAKYGKKSIKGKNLVYATHIPPGITQFSFRCAPYRSYVLGVTLKDEAQYPDCMAYDMEDPYHYFRSHTLTGKKMLLVGGADHKTGHADPEKAYAEMEKYVKKYFDVKTIEHRWSSQYYIPVDGLPYIGKADGERLCSNGL